MIDGQKEDCPWPAWQPALPGSCHRSTTSPRANHHGRDARATMRRQDCPVRASGPRSQGRRVEAQRPPQSPADGSRGWRTPGGVRGAVGPLCNNPPNEVSGGEAMGFAKRTRRRPSAGRLRSSLIAKKNAPTIVPSRAGVPEPRVQVGASPSRHGLSGRLAPYGNERPGGSGFPRTQQGHSYSSATRRRSPPSTGLCLSDAGERSHTALDRGSPSTPHKLSPPAIRPESYAVAVWLRAFSGSSPPTTASTCAP